MAYNFQHGSRVLGQWSDGYWYPATVQSTHNGQYTLTFDDGDSATVYSNQVTPLNWTTGSRVQCNWLGKGKYYSGTITSQRGHNIHVSYDDGDQENTSVGRCRASKATASTAHQQQVQSIRESSRHVPDDPQDFLNAIERNRGY